TVFRGKLIFDPETVRVSDADNLVALSQAGFSSTHVRDLSAFFFPPPTQQIFNTGLHLLLEAVDLRGSLIGDLLHRAVKKPTSIAVVGLDSANTGTHELRAFAIRIFDVIKKACGNLGNVIAIG